MSWTNDRPNPDDVALIMRTVVVNMDEQASWQAFGRVIAFDYRPHFVVELARGGREFAPMHRVHLPTEEEIALYPRLRAFLKAHDGR